MNSLGDIQAVHIRIVLTVAACLVAVTACEPEAETSEIGSETVPVVFKGHDDAIVVKKTASVTDEDYDEQPLGQVTLWARTATKAPDRNRHYLAGRVILNDGKAVECSEGRSFIWSDFGKFEDIELVCDEYVIPTDVRSFELDLS